VKIEIRKNSSIVKIKYKRAINVHTVWPFPLDSRFNREYSGFVVITRMQSSKRCRRPSLNHNACH